MASEAQETPEERAQREAFWKAEEEDERKRERNPLIQALRKGTLEDLRKLLEERDSQGRRVHLFNDYYFTEAHGDAQETYFQFAEKYRLIYSQPEMKVTENRVYWLASQYLCLTIRDRKKDEVLTGGVTVQEQEVIINEILEFLFTKPTGPGSSSDFTKPTGPGSSSDFTRPREWSPSSMLSCTIDLCTYSTPSAQQWFIGHLIRLGARTTWHLNPESSNPNKKEVAETKAIVTHLLARKGIVG